jgi:hypothetical protein
MNGMRNMLFGILCGCSALAVTNGAAAQPIDEHHVVQLTNGVVIAGRVRNLGPTSVTIELPNGRLLEIPNQQVADVNMTPRERPLRQVPRAPGRLYSGQSQPAPGQAQPPSPGTYWRDSQTQVDVGRGQIEHREQDASGTTTTQFDVPGGRASQSSVSADGRTTSTAGVDARQGASYAQQHDCSGQNANTPICQERMSAQLGPGGAQFGYQQTTVEAVKEPPNGFTSARIMGGASYGTTLEGDLNMDIVGGSAAVTIRRCFGGQLPGRDGGGWVGLAVGGDVMASVGYYEASMYIPNYGDMSFSGTNSTLTLTGGIGLQLLHFGSMDPDTLKQSGFGAYLGYRLGGQTTTQTPEEGESTSSEDFTHGPELTFTFPKYNAGTADVKEFAITILVMPAGDFLFATFQIGFGF